MTDLIRGSSLANFASLVSDLGGDAVPLLQMHGVDPVVAGDHERFITYSGVAAVVGAAAEELRCPDFGLRLARKQGIDILGPVAVIARHADTVADAVDGVSKYLHTYSPSIVSELRRGTGTSYVGFAITLRRLRHRDQMVELSLAITVGLLRFLIDPEFVPVHVTMAHPRISAPEVYDEFFGCPVQFESDLNRVEVPNSVLVRQIHGRDAAALALAEKYLAPLRPDLTVADYVRDLVQRLLPLDQATLVGVASAMTLHPRVLQRRLAEENTTFEAILDDVRRVSAWQLSATGMQGSRIAAMLGYAEQSSYSRACRRWFGHTPRQLIAHVRKHPGEPLNNR